MTSKVSSDFSRLKEESFAGVSLDISPQERLTNVSSKVYSDLVRLLISAAEWSVFEDDSLDVCVLMSAAVLPAS